MVPVYLIVGIPFFAALLVFLLHALLKDRYVGWYVLAVPLILFAALCSYLPQAAKGNYATESIPWIPSFDIQFTIHADGLGLLFGLLITGIGSLVMLYSIYYMKHQKSLYLFYTYLLLFMGAMLGIAFSDHMLFLYAFWELTSIVSFFLIAFWYQRKRSRYGAQKSLLITVFGGIAMLAAFMMLHQITGTFSIQETLKQIAVIHAHPLFKPAMLLLLLGAFTKSAQFPFHIWLPDAMEAPTPVSSYLHAATMVKAGIYLVARFTPVFGGDGLWLWLVSGTGLFTLLWGAFLAIRQRDLKALLAYSTISQLGLIMCLLGLGSAAFTGDTTHAVWYGAAIFAALFHLINHSTFKGNLFMIVGIIDLTAGTRDIRRLGGLLAFMPVTFLLAIVGSFSMAGLPPFNGFLSKELFFTHAAEAVQLSAWGWVFPVIAVVASMMTFAYSMVLIFKVFFGPYQGNRLDRTPKEAPFGMLLAPAILSGLIFAIFIWPNVLAKYVLQPALASILPQTGRFPVIEIVHWHGWNTAFTMTILAVLGGLILFLFGKHWQQVYKLFPEGWTIDRLYQKMLLGTERFANGFTNLYMTERTTHYIAYIFGAFILFMGGMLFFEEGFTIDFAKDAPLEAYELILAFVMAIAGIAILFARTRLTAVILNGVLGYAIALFFVLFRAPDLALTQLVVETVTTALFLASFYFLPDFPPRKKGGKASPRLFRLLLSIVVGLVFVMTALAVKSFRHFESISSYFETTEQPAGGGNIVNAILADFRAFDTMLETIVLLIAGLGVYAIIKASKRRIRDED